MKTYIKTIKNIVITSMIFMCTFSTTYALDIESVNIRESLLPLYDTTTELTRIAWHSTTTDATLLMTPVGEAKLNATSTLQVIVEPGSVSINAVSLRIQYSTTTLAFNSINESDTAFSFSFVESIDFDTGIIIIHYLQPYPGISERSNVVDLQFTPIASGTSTIAFMSDTKVLANDGYGTNVLNSAPSIQFVIN